ncbi:metallophosphatase [Christiangramia salexigens]|uniref:Metallophosphatase n=1 Tax=Christiangramia salexigens TaxID=1913577 RepID=A0A1L3J6B2_9FLAO|nr:metallophosphatase [Christiangramia salexigens]APG60667.1 metallophosphatase [Christiangramia salexigens]
MDRFNKLLQTNNFLKHFSCLFLVLFSITAFSQNEQGTKNKEIVHSVYVTSNTGNRTDENNRILLTEIAKTSRNEKSSSLVVVGNVVPEKGYPNKDNGRKEVEEYLKQNLLDHLKDFNGKVIFTPGYNEWQADAPDNIDDLESFLQDNSDSEFWPNDGCPIEGESLSDDVELVMVDSQWYLEDWDDHPYINNKCDYKTRLQFITEFQDELKDNQGKTILVAVHHPVLSKTKVGFFEKIIGAGSQSWRNPEYKDLRGQLETLASQYNDVIFLSGNNTNMQFVQDDGIEQIISGVTEKPKKAKPEKDKGHFASYELAYAKVNIFKDGSSNVEFFEVNSRGSKQIFSEQIKRERTRIEEVSWLSKDQFGETQPASVYTEEETDKDPLYKFLWGEHYRPLYSTKFDFPVLFLDTLPGNMRPIAEGGGHQSRSLRFIDDDEHEYTLRALKKSAIRFIQSTVVTNHYVEDYLKNTVAERYVQDFYTTAHPYAPMAVNGLMDALEIKHATPKIYYVPKQEALGIYNKDYGNELYMLEEHVGDENKDLKAFGSPKDIISTKDLMLEMAESKEAYVDEDLYLRARLLDMLIGDWDRHSDQWRWAEYKEGDKKRYEPIPRDRDQAFPRFDGPVISLLKLGYPQLMSMENYDAMINRPKWFNVAAFPLDKTFIKTSKWEDWKQQVEYIQNQITPEVIEESFKSLPAGTEKHASVEKIKEILNARKANLEKIARDYYELLKKYDVITGTEDDDKFNITRQKNGVTNIEIINEDGRVVFNTSYNSGETDQLWIYGLDGDDEFVIDGDGDDLIKLKILGGEENDIYDFRNKRKAKLYDYKSKKNTIKTPGARKWLVDSYDINNYDPNKKMLTKLTMLPSLSFNSDTGLKVGAKTTYTTYGLVTNPFTTQQSLSANYYFDTQGFDLGYYGEFAQVFYNWNLGIDAYYSSPNFTMNYFGEGNDVQYDPDDVSRDFNRVKIQQWRFAPSLIWKNVPKSSFYFKPMIESYEVSDDDARYIGQAFDPSNDVYTDQLYAGAEVNYNYFNKDNVAFPSRGMELDLTAGYKTNIDNANNEFGYIRPMLSIDYPLHESGVAAIATKIGGEAIIGDNYEFYHGAFLGGGDQNSLRGYRNQRFNGKYAFYQNTDLRVGITQFRTNFIPIRMGVSGGFDYGRVWLDDDNSGDWHTNYGGSVFINAFYAFTGNLGYYVGDDGGRFNFSINFNF